MSTSEPTVGRKLLRLPKDAYTLDRVFLVTTATQDRFPWFSRYPGLADRAARMLRETAAERGTALHAWCIMPDHVHLVLQDRDLSGFMRLFKGRLTPFARVINPARRLWQKSFHDRSLIGDVSVLSAMSCTWLHPVRAGIVQRARDYRWSGSEVWERWWEVDAPG